MTLEKAIELLQGYVKPTAFVPREDIDDAISLGIEALYRCQEFRNYATTRIYMPLSGETTE